MSSTTIFAERIEPRVVAWVSSIVGTVRVLAVAPRRWFDDPAMQVEELAIGKSYVGLHTPDTDAYRDG
jgi:hypothetical protein